MSFFFFVYVYQSWMFVLLMMPHVGPMIRQYNITITRFKKIDVMIWMSFFVLSIKQNLERHWVSLVEQTLLIILPQLNSPTIFSGIHVAQSYIFYAVCFLPLSVFIAIVLFVLWITASDYTFGICKLFFLQKNKKGVFDMRVASILHWYMY